MEDLLTDSIPVELDPYARYFHHDHVDPTMVPVYDASVFDTWYWDGEAWIQARKRVIIPMVWEQYPDLEGFLRLHPALADVLDVCLVEQGGQFGVFTHGSELV